VDSHSCVLWQARLLSSGWIDVTGEGQTIWQWPSTGSHSQRGSASKCLLATYFQAENAITEQKQIIYYLSVLFCWRYPKILPKSSYWSYPPVISFVSDLPSSSCELCSDWQAQEFLTFAGYILTANTLDLFVHLLITSKAPQQSSLHPRILH